MTRDVDVSRDDDSLLRQFISTIRDPSPQQSVDMAVFVLFVAVLVHQCSGQDTYDAIVETGVVYIHPSGPLFVIGTVTQGE